MTRQRLFRPNPILEIDQRGYIYLNGLKLCRFIRERGVLEFQDHSRTARQGRRIIEVAPADLSQKIIRLTEQTG